MHIPVLVNKVISIIDNFVSKDEDFIFFDMTFGFGGHTACVLNSFPRSVAFGYEIDPDIFGQLRSSSKLHEFFKQKRLDVQNRSYVEADLRSFKKDLKRVILFDFGINSFQQDGRMSFESSLPFSLSFSAPKAFDKFKSIEVINQALRQYSDFSAQDADAISEIVFKYQGLPQVEIKKIIVEKFRFIGFSNLQRFLSRIWQALRILVNDEFKNEELGIRSALCVNRSVTMAISFHSSEDRLVKNLFRSWQKEHSGCTILTKKPVDADAYEVEQNIRSRSAKLRAMQIL